MWAVGLLVWNGCHPRTEDFHHWSLEWNMFFYQSSVSVLLKISIKLTNCPASSETERLKFVNLFESKVTVNRLHKDNSWRPALTAGKSGWYWKCSKFCHCWSKSVNVEMSRSWHQMLLFVSWKDSIIFFLAIINRNVFCNNFNEWTLSCHLFKTFRQLIFITIVFFKSQYSLGDML